MQRSNRAVKDIGRVFRGGHKARGGELFRTQLIVNQLKIRGGGGKTKNHTNEPSGAGDRRK